MAESLSRVFDDDEVEFQSLLAMPTDSISSTLVTYPAPVSNAPTIVDRLVARIRAEVERREAPDFVFAVDDLELPNVGTPQNVTGVVRDAVTRALGSSPRHTDVARFRDRCSFHLICPMLEAYFYGEPNALTRAGALAAPVISAQHHLEEFLATDVAYTAPPDEDGHDWFTPDRAMHPKRYLRYLVSPDEYRETAGGVSALSTLAWADVFARQPGGLAFAIALFDDIADAIGVAPPYPGIAHPVTARRQNGTLRNL